MKQPPPIATTPPTFNGQAVAERRESIRTRTYGFGFALAALWASWLATLTAFCAAWIAERCCAAGALTGVDVGVLPAAGPLRVDTPFGSPRSASASTATRAIRIAR